MTSNYSKVWQTMNDLEMVTSKVCSAREILDCAAEALENHRYAKVEALIYAADEFLQYYLEEFDSKFKDAWQETVVNSKNSTHYTEEEMDAMCSHAEKQDYRGPVIDNKHCLNYQEAIAAGWKMSADGFWIPPQDNTDTKS